MPQFDLQSCLRPALRFNEILVWGWRHGTRGETWTPWASRSALIHYKSGREPSVENLTAFFESSALSYRPQHDGALTREENSRSWGFTTRWKGRVIRGSQLPRQPRGDWKVSDGYYSRSIFRQAVSTPAEYLVAALKDGGYQWALPEERTDGGNAPGRIPIRVDPRKFRQLRSTAQLAIKPDVATKVTPLSLWSILSDYIRLLHPVLYQENVASSADGLEIAKSIDQRLLLVYDEPTLDYLSERGFSPEDVMTWAWIILSRTSRILSWRLTIASQESNKPAPPTFVFLHILGRPYLSAEALKLLLINGWARLPIPMSDLIKATEDGFISNQLSRMARSSKVGQGHLNFKNFVIIIFRLTRHARLVWSAGLPSIAAMITSYVGDVVIKNSLWSRFKTGDNRARITFLFNRCLFLLGLPSSGIPFASIPYHQRAQFHLLETMARLQPPILVTREGYRAMARVQLAHRKTPHEREWAQYKAKSWPPWKEEKLGIDAERGDEGMISRAGQVLSRMQEAGYGHGNYEQVANIFAGWDTDKSPTIQTRTLLPRATGIGQDVEEPDAKQQVWAARVRATRTLREAWACFLAHRDSVLPPSAIVYYAMAEKIVFSEKTSTTTTALPGDSMEVFPEPISPRELTYVRSPPPTLEVLLDSMRSDRVVASGRFLKLLIRHARRPDAGLRHLWSSLPRATQALTTPTTLVQHPDTIKTLPKNTIIAIIYLLCRSSERVEKVEFGSMPAPSLIFTPEPETRFTIEDCHAEVASIDSPPSPIMQVENDDGIPYPLARALKIMGILKPRYRRPWNEILSAFARVGARLEGPYQNMPEISGWIAITQVLTQMERLDIDIDFKAFQTLCVGLEKAILGRSKRRIDSYNSEAVDEILYKGAVLVKQEFVKLVSTTDKVFSQREIKLPSEPGPRVDPTTLIPLLLSVPDSAHLHALIRVLGLVSDFDGLLSLLKWMERFQPELQALADERANGPTLMRRSLVAARVFFESSWISLDDAPSGADQELIAEAYDTIERMDGWGGWPSDEEVKIYVGNWPDRESIRGVARLSQMRVASRTR